MEYEDRITIWAPEGLALEYTLAGLGSRFIAELADVLLRLGREESAWRSLAIAGQASQNLGDKTRAREYALRARDSLSKLEQRWNAASYKSYLSRPDVQRLRKQLDQLTGVA